MKQLSSLAVACALLLSLSFYLRDVPRSSDWKISTGSVAAQAAFDRALTLCWGFNHDAAVLAFDEVLQHDPESAIANWGKAYALGPNINLPLTDEAVAMRAYQAIEQARTLADGASDIERTLIEAMATRFADPPPEDRSQLDQAYADMMRAAWTRFPDDPNVGVLFADALMNLSNKWRSLAPDGDRGPHTPEIVATLEKVLAAYPEHVGGNHFYIHSVEASTRPERALRSASRLATLVPDAGHLLHMPSHIYIRVGQYRDAIEANVRAVAADDEFFANAGPQNIYHYYRAHNAHFLAWAAMFQGDKASALDAAYAMVSKLPKERLSELPRSIESYLFVPVHVMMRFGLWQDILATDSPGAQFPIAVALWHHARGVAYANTERIDLALAEKEAFEKVAATIPASKRVRRAKVEDLLETARQMMQGEILFKQGKQREAFVALRKGVAAEDSMPYAEPPGWMQPIRHALGALLLEAGKAVEAEVVYREDLAQHAKNGWSLHGLAECLRIQGKQEEAERVEALFREAWADADTEITASCFCRTKD